MQYVFFQLRFGEAGLNVVTKGKMVLDVFGLVFKAAFLDENFISAIIFFKEFPGVTSVKKTGLEIQLE